MAYEKEDGTMVTEGEYDVFAVYEFIIKHDDGIVYEAYETAEEALKQARVWLVIEMGGTDAEASLVASMTDEEVYDTISDYDFVSFCDVAHRRVLFG
jgi:hypothetical protein